MSSLSQRSKQTRSSDASSAFSIADARRYTALAKCDRGNGDKPNGDTIYEIGSVTKAFTGTLLADMVNRGLVKLDAPLQDFMPTDVKLHLAKNQPIRLVDLASQTSGLPRLPDNMQPKDPSNPYADYTPERMFEFLGKHQLRRPPGEYEYSNLGMGLLGHMLAKQAGQTYEQLVIERICDPLKMTDTRITLSDEQRKRLAPPYNAELGDEKELGFRRPGRRGRPAFHDQRPAEAGRGLVERRQSPGREGDSRSLEATIRQAGRNRRGPRLAHCPRRRHSVAQRPNGRIQFGALRVSTEKVGRRRAVQHGHGAHHPARRKNPAVGTRRETGANRGSQNVHVAPAVLKTYEGTYALSCCLPSRSRLKTAS